MIFSACSAGADHITFRYSVKGSECRLSKRIYVAETNKREGFLECLSFFKRSDVIELKIVHNPTNAVAEKKERQLMKLNVQKQGWTSEDSSFTA